MRGVVAAGHPLTAQAGADVLREGGNAVDAAVAAVLMSFVAESPLTGPGAGGFMLVHTASGENHLLDFFVAAPGQGHRRARAGAAGADRRGVRRGRGAAVQLRALLVRRLRHHRRAGRGAGALRHGRRWATSPAAPARAAREGVEVIPMQALPVRDPRPDHALDARGGGDLRARGAPAARGRAHAPARAGRPARPPGRRGARASSTTGDVAAACSDWVLERGGLLTREDLAAYEVVERPPARARFRGREVLTNPPPSSGGILIADALELLERIDRPGRHARAGRGDRLDQPRARRGVPRRA